MKKKILGGIAVLAIAAVAAFNVSLNAQQNNLSNISIANVEALAQYGEGENCYYASKENHTSVWEEKIKIEANFCMLVEYTETSTVCIGYNQGHVCCSPDYNISTENKGYCAC